MKVHLFERFIKMRLTKYINLTFSSLYSLFITASRYRSDNRNHICRSIYPPGGYLKVSFEHYQKLIRLDVFPKYKAKQTLQREKKRRHKRDDNTYYNGNNDNNNNNNDNSNNNNNIDSIIYCCYHKCDEEFFC